MSEQVTGSEHYPNRAATGSSLAGVALCAELRLSEGDLLAPREDMLRASFSDMVAGIPMRDVAKVISGSRGRRLMERIDDYRLVPVIGRAGKLSTDMARTDCDIPEGVSVTCDLRYCDPGEVYLDTNYGIGLVYQDRLCGLAGSQLGTYADVDGKLAPSVALIQNQAMTTAARNEGSDSQRSGLREGLRWRETLVGAWVHVAGQMGVDRMVIGSAHGNRWNTHHDIYPDRDKQLRASLDDVADGLHFTFVPGETSSYWYREL